MAPVGVHGLPLSDCHARGLVLSLIEDGSKHEVATGETMARAMANKLERVG